MLVTMNVLEELTRSRARQNAQAVPRENEAQEFAIYCGVLLPYPTKLVSVKERERACYAIQGCSKGRLQVLWPLSINQLSCSI